MCVYMRFCASAWVCALERVSMFVCVFCGPLELTLLSLRVCVRFVACVHVSVPGRR